MYKLETCGDHFNLFIEVREIGLEGIKEKLEKADLTELKRAYKEHGFKMNEIFGKVTKERLIDRIMRFAKFINGMNENINNYMSGKNK